MCVREWNLGGSGVTEVELGVVVSSMAKELVDYFVYEVVIVEEVHLNNFAI